MTTLSSGLISACKYMKKLIFVIYTSYSDTLPNNTKTDKTEIATLANGIRLLLLLLTVSFIEIVKSTKLILYI
jgi:zona occludens toxin (predicted ATPase)